MSLAFVVSALVVAALTLGVLRWRARPRWTPAEIEARAAAARAILQQMRDLARPALLLAASQEPGFSKLGGEPELPADFEWPTAEDRPLAFLAQLDLAEISAAGGPEWLPRSGRLWAFNDDQGYGTADHIRVLHAGPELQVAPRAFPPQLHRRHRYGERGVAFVPTISAPSLEWLGVDLRNVDFSGVSPEEAPELPDKPPGEREHQIGGYPSEIQDERMSFTAELLARGLSSDGPLPPDVEEAARYWRLLLQIDSDPALGMDFSASGRLYVFITEKHARAGDFSKTISNWQTY